jgi:NAD+ diphosphatase
MKTYYFVFCKEDLLLERTADGIYTIPLQEEPPTEVKPWTHQMNITPMHDGTPVITYSIDAPVVGHERLEMCGLRQSYYKLPRALYLKAGKCQ